jgi:nucleoside-diphosphate-sugar epimerase
MRILVTGAAGHLGEALVRTLRGAGREVVGLDVLASPYVAHVGSIVDRACVRRAMAGVGTVFHAATLHKPHVATHDRQAFVDTNIRGTLNLLEEASAAGVESFVFTSTTSVFGDALTPPPGAPAAWITEDIVPVPKNIYGVTKAAAEDLCQMFHRNQGLACLVLRTSRFFPEADDDPSVREAYADDNHKTNEYLHRRVDIEDVVSAHLLAARRAPAIGFGKYIVSATTPFRREDAGDLAIDAPAVIRRRVPAYEAEYRKRGWTMFPRIGRVYVNDRARRELGWRPVHDFASVIERLKAGGETPSALARAIGAKGYHGRAFAEGPLPGGVN